MDDEMYRDYPGSRRDEQWIGFVTANQQRMMIDRWPGSPFARQSFVFNTPGEQAAIGVRSLVVEDVFYKEYEGSRSLPEVLPRLRHLEYLALPIPYIKDLERDAIPASVRVLAAIGKGSARFQKGLQLPHVTQLLAWEAQVDFDEGAFPSLVRLAARTSTERSWKLLAKLQLGGLDCGPIGSSAAFHHLRGEGLTHLNVHGGSIESLEGLQRLEQLRYLRLKNLPRLRDISALRHLPALVELDILYCSAIEQPEVLAEIPPLRRLLLVRCRGLTAESLSPLFGDRTLEQLRIT